MNNYIRITYLEIILLLVTYLLGSGIISYIFQIISTFLHINPYILSPLSILLNYVFIFLFYRLIISNSKKEKFIVNYSLQGFKYFPIAFLLFLGQSVIAEFLTGLIPTDGKYLGYLYKIMENALMGNINQYPIITFFSLCIIAPICEEIFFRGLILKGLLNNKIPPVKAIIISAIIFGGIHIFPWQMVGGISAGIILGVVFYKTGSLLTCTLLHFINNTFGYLIYIKYKNLQISDILPYNEAYILIIGIALLVLFGYLYLKKTINFHWKPY